MKAVTKIIFLDDEGEKFFGEGPARLMHAIEETGSWLIESCGNLHEYGIHQSFKTDSQCRSGAGFFPDSSADRREGWRRKYLDTGRKGVAVSL